MCVVHRGEKEKILKAKGSENFKEGIIIEQ
jgi:hypothetical protein